MPAPTELIHRFQRIHRPRALPDGRGSDCTRIERGTLTDYLALSRFHYRAARPATIARILRATDPHTGELAGVLVVSMPVLNAPWRQTAWPTLFAATPSSTLFTATPHSTPSHSTPQRLNASTPSPHRLHASLINSHIRTISRVIIDPRHRATGLATHLVRAYLADPLTDYTEAIAAMGATCPIFQSAGMRELPLPPSRALARLRQALTIAGLPPLALIEHAAASPYIQHHLCQWANDSRGTRPLLHRPPHHLAKAAYTALSAERRIYVTQQPSINTNQQTEIPSDLSDP